MGQPEPRDALGCVAEGEVQVAVHPGRDGGVEPVADPQWRSAAPEQVAHVRSLVIDVLSPEQLRRIGLAAEHNRFVQPT